MNKPSVFPATLDTLCYELNGIWNVASLIGIAEVADLARETALKQAGLDLTECPRSEEQRQLQRGAAPPRRI